MPESVRDTDDVIRLIWQQATLSDLTAIQQSIQVYRDDFADIVEAELNKQFTDPQVRARMAPLISTELNVCKRIVNETAMVYKRAASRMALVGETEDARYTDILSECQINSVMKSVNRYTRLLNHVLIRPVIRRGKMQLDIILPDNFEIFTNEDDWQEIVAVRYYTGTSNPITQEQREATGLSTINREEAYLWVKKTCQITENSSTKTLEPGIYEYKVARGVRTAEYTPFPYQNESGENVLPFVLTYKEWPVDSLLNFTRDSAMVETSINLCIYMTMLNELMKFQSFKQVAITGDFQLPDGMRVGPGTIWQIKSTGTANQANIDVLDMQGPVRELWEVIKERMTIACAQYGIPPSSMTLTGNPSSGYALKIDRSGLEEVRENDIEIYRGIERDLFEVMRIVNNTDHTQKINPQAMFKVDFAEASYPDSPQEEATKWQTRISNNVASPIDWIKSDNPDLTDDEAQAKYATNKQINQSRIGLQPVTAPEGIATR